MRGVSITLSERELKDWQRMKVNRLPSWWDRFKAKKEDFEPESQLDALIDLREEALRKLDVYGADFSLDREKVFYKGNIEALVEAVQNDLIVGVAVEAYPQSALKKGKIQDTKKWWLNALEANGWAIGRQGPGIDHDDTLKDVANYQRLSFLCGKGPFKSILEYGRAPRLSTILAAGLAPSGKPKDFQYWDTSHDLEYGGFVEFTKRYVWLDPDGDPNIVKNLISFNRRAGLMTKLFGYIVV